MKKKYIRMSEFTGPKSLQLLADQVADNLMINRVKVSIKNGRNYIERSDIAMPSSMGYKVVDIGIHSSMGYEYEACHIIRVLRVIWYCEKHLGKTNKLKDLDILMMNFDSAIYTIYYLYYVEHIKPINQFRSDSVLQKFISYVILPNLEKKYKNANEFLNESTKKIYPDATGCRYCIIF